VQEFSTPRIGTIFQKSRGKLFSFDVSSISVMAVWPKPLAWRKTRRRGWYHYRPKITIPAGPLDAVVRIQPAHPGPDGEQDRPPVVEPLFPFELAWRRWYDRIPVEVRNAIAPFRSRHWQLLSLVARCGNAALDLLIANPALAYALASNWIFHKPAVQRPLRSARALLAKGKRQRDILEWLSFPATEAFRKLLMKVSPKRSASRRSSTCVRMQTHPER
jgi:hypothetical protein